MALIIVSKEQEGSAVNCICFSFDRKDLTFVLFLYNISYFATWWVIRSDFKICFLISFLISLALLLSLTTFDLYELIAKKKTIQGEEENLALKKIRDEYQKIYRLKHKRELLAKTGALAEEEIDTVISDGDDPAINLENRDSTSNSVHFNYSNRYGTSRLHPKN